MQPYILRNDSNVYYQPIDRNYNRAVIIDNLRYYLHNQAQQFIGMNVRDFQDSINALLHGWMRNNVALGVEYSIRNNLIQNEGYSNTLEVFITLDNHEERIDFIINA